MRSKIFILAVIFNLVTFCQVLAQERILKGEFSATGVAPKIEGEKAKFNEYRDIRDGVYVGVDTRHETERYYLDFKAENIGYKTQKYGLSGGKWGSFKYHLDYDDIPHNFTYGAKTFYSGVGGANLTYSTSPPSTDISTWTTFDYSIQRTTYGGGFKLEMLKPFYFDVAFSEEKRKGVYPFAAAGGTSPGQGAIELPAPIDFTTDNLKIEAGYLKAPLSLSVGYFYSTFRNENIYLNFRNPSSPTITATTPDISTLPPNNTDYKLEFKGAVKLPLNSKFNVNLSTGSTQTSVNLLSSYVTPTALRVITLSDYVFDGKIDRQNYDFLLTSSPVYFLNGKVFYKYYNTNNKSDLITTTDGTSTFTNPLFDYRKVKYGAELGFKLPAGFYLTPAYTHVLTQRAAREDIPKNDDDIYGFELKWSGLEFMVAKAGYERLQRRGDFHGPDITGPTDSANIEQYQRRYDVAPRDQDTYKASLDLFPIERLNVSLRYKYKDTNYKETILGLRKAKRDEFNVDADYLIGKRVRLFGFFDYEYVKLDQFQRQIPFGTTLFNPANPPTSTAYNWTMTQTENNYAYGLGADIYLLLEKLTLRLQHNLYKSDGYADYTYLLNSIPLPGGRTQDNIDIPNWGKYETRHLSAKLTYNATKSLLFSAGYVYEKFIADDAQYNGYLYSSGVAPYLTYLTGAYKNLSYEANIAFLSAAYRF